MGAKTGIEWTDTTWNPIRGCSRVSEGCRNCYAESMAHRFSGPGQPYEGLTKIVNGRPAWTGKVALIEKHLLDPLKQRPVRMQQTEAEEMAGCRSTRWRRIFVNSMSDLFHESVPDEWIDRIFAVMALCPQHTFQVLTKRPERMLAYCSDDAAVARILREAAAIARSLVGFVSGAMYQKDDGMTGICVPNVWLGVSVEDQETADERIPLLLQTPAAVLFISYEPALGAVDLKPSWINPTRQNYNPLNWVICGGESGKNARPMHPDWARGVRDQCVAAGVPFFFKQWGEWARTGSVDVYGRIVDGKEIKGRKYPNSEGVAMLRDGRVCLKDFTVAEHERRIKNHEASSTAAIRVDGEALKEFHASIDDPVENVLGYEWMYRVGKKAAGSLLDGVEWKQFPA